MVKGDGDSFRTMFPDSKISEKYSQNETKIKHVILYGISPNYIQYLLKSYLKGKFDHSSLMRPELPKSKNSTTVMFSIGANF